MYRDYVRPIYRKSSARLTAFCGDQVNGLGGCGWKDGRLRAMTATSLLVRKVD